MTSNHHFASFRIVVAFLLILFMHPTLAQENKKMDYIDFLANWIQADTSKKSSSSRLEMFGGGYYLENVDIDFGALSKEQLKACSDSSNNVIAEMLLAKYPELDLELDSLNRIVIDKSLEVKNVNFGTEGFNCLSCLKTIIFDYEDQTLSIENSSIERLIVYPSFASNPEINSDFKFVGGFFLNDSRIREGYIFTPPNQKELAWYLDLFRTEFGYLNLRGKDYHQIAIVDCRFELPADFTNTKSPIMIDYRLEDLMAFTFEDNLVKTTGASYLEFRVEAEDINISRNDINADFSIAGSAAKDRFTLKENDFTGLVSLNDFQYSETYNKIDWNDLKGRLSNILIDLDSSEEIDNKHLHITTIEESISIYFQQPSIENQNADFDILIKDYYYLYSIFRSAGNIAFANSAYSEMKDIENLRYAKNYKEDKMLKNLFKWKLGQLLKFYTDNGTDPAKAMVISFQIMLLFSIFYFFFPSEWDVTSKNQLIQNIRSAANKHEDGTWKAILRSVLLLMLSMINAMTLSLNSFVTLGFGTIPTTGLARYVCIVQGFIGWFLLSLFSVSLINQVLF